MKIVRGAVERIDDPRVFGAGERLAVFLAEDAVIGIRLVQYLDDRVFGVAVDVGDEIVALLLDDVQRVDAIHRAHHDLTRAAAGAKRHVDHCVHERKGGVVEGRAHSSSVPVRHETTVIMPACATLEHVRIVLVETSHPGNIGGAARAMKTMGLEQLWLVRPHVIRIRKRSGARPARSTCSTARWSSIRSMRRSPTARS